MSEEDESVERDELEARIRELEAQIEKLIQEQGQANSESQAEIDSIKKNLRKSESKAEKIIDDPEETEKVLAKALKKIGKSKLIAEAVDDLQTLIRMVRAYVNGEYREVPVGTIVAALGAVVYFVSPIDAIPDFIPIGGYVDDAAVIAAVVIVIKSDIDEFRQWEASQAR